MKVHTQSDTQLLLESFTWDIALIAGALFVVPLLFVAIALIGGGELLLIPLLVSALAAALFTIFVGRRSILLDATGDQIELRFRSLARETLMKRTFSDLKGAKLMGSIGEHEPKDIDPDNLPAKRHRYVAALEFQTEGELVISGNSMIWSDAPKLVRVIRDWMGNGGR